MTYVSGTSGTWLIEPPGMSAARERIGELTGRGLPVAIASIEMTPYGEDGVVGSEDSNARLFAELQARLAAFASRERWILVPLSAERQILVMPCVSVELAERRFGRVVHEWGAGLSLGSTQVVVDLAAGICASPLHGKAAADLLMRAGCALHEARRLRVPVIVYREGMEQLRVRRLQLRSDLAAAIPRGQLSLDYQPQLALGSRRIGAVEALVRWRHPVLGPVPPAEFIPLAEETGCITEITDWVVATALSQLAAWRDEGLQFDVAVNLSAHDLASDELYRRVAQHLLRHRIDGCRLTLELTEHAVVADMQRAAAAMSRVARCGVRFALDDFGTGHASLEVLRALPLAEIKIDRAFTRDLLRGARDELIVASAVSLAHGLRLQVVAEGIESAQTLDAVTRLRCDRAQGYFIGRPMSAARIRDCLVPTGTSGPRVADEVPAAGA